MNRIAAALILAVFGVYALPGIAQADAGVPFTPDYATAQASHEGCLTVLDDAYGRYLAVVQVADADAANVLTVQTLQRRTDELEFALDARSGQVGNLMEKVSRKDATIARLRAKLAHR